MESTRIAVIPPNEQEQIVKDAFEMSYSIAQDLELKEQIENESYIDPPQAPIKQTIKKPQYPKIKVDCPFNWIACFAPIAAAVVLGILGFMSIFTEIEFLSIILVTLSSLLFPLSIIWIFIYIFAIYDKAKREMVNEVKNSKKYKMQCADIDNAYNNDVALADQEYATAMEQYTNGPLAKYQQEYAEWEYGKNARLHELSERIDVNAGTLNTLYDESRLIPPQYRSIDRLEYIYQIMSTTDYTVKDAIAMYDREMQRMLDEAKLQEMQIANQNAELQNALLDEQNTIAAKARRDANIAAVVGAVQRHNTNRYLRK